ncbi:MAG: tRNA lysidine(34) synthetase TilS [Spirochaetes bacterium]|nr:tRNA lysidine(34) synthetase TilS [Spirochaetota bacterium]
MVSMVMNSTDSKVLEFIHRNKLILPHQRVLLSLSAGKDSMALLHILRNLCEKLSCSLEIFHLNHCARGLESDGDESFIVQLAESYNIPFTIKRVDVRRSKPAKSSFEEHARLVRYRLLHEVRLERNCDIVATAHTIDDSIETVLMRLFQGTGLFGISGIEFKRDFIIRPLLCLTQDEVYSYLIENGILWREDSSNRDISYVRNYVRHVVLPKVRGRFPQYRNAIMRLSDIVRDTCAIIDLLIEQQYGKLYRWTNDGMIVEVGKISQNEMICRHLIARAFHELGLPLRKTAVDDIVRKLKSQRPNVRVFEGKGLQATKMRDGNSAVLYISQCRDAIADEWCYRISLESLPCVVEIKKAGIKLEIFYCDEEFFLLHKGSVEIAFIALDNNKISLLIRNRKPGDEIALSFGTKKIKNLYIEAKLSFIQKKRIPIVEVEGVIAAVLLGIAGKGHNRISRDFMVTKSSKKILAIKGV